MKKLISSFLIALTLIAATTTKKAEAGVLLGGSFIAGGILAETDPEQKLLGFSISGGIIAGAIIGGRAIIKVAKGNPWGIASGITLIVLDQKNSNEQLVQQFPFLDNQEVVQNLSDALIDKYETQEKVDGLAIVKLTTSEVEEILAPMDLTMDQINLVMNDLTK